MLVVLYYANRFGYGPVDALWEAVLLLAGHAVSLLAVLEWSVMLGCSGQCGYPLSAGHTRVSGGAEPVTVRGPVTYAGTGLARVAPSRRFAAERSDAQAGGGPNRHGGLPPLSDQRCDD